MQTPHRGILILLAVLVLVPYSAVAGPYDSTLAGAINTYLSNLSPPSPLAGSGSVFLSAGSSYSVDPRLIVAIAGAESNYGAAAVCPSGFDAWNWLPGVACVTGNPFASYSDGIQTVTGGIRLLYLDMGLNTIDLIGQAYCSGGCTAAWVTAVTNIYTSLGGDPTDLSFAGTVIDFEQFSGASCCFTNVEPPYTIGIATISGGAVLGTTSNLPVDQSAVYGTASPYCFGCLNTIMIDFIQPVSNFSLFLINGNTTTVTYTAVDDQGGQQTITLVSNYQSGAGTIALPEAGVTNVTISSGPPGPGACCGWDFFIDNISFDPQ
jgi:hypothetical protein